MLKAIQLFILGIPAIISGMLALMGRKAITAAASVAAFLVLLVAFISAINTILQTVLAVLSMPAWISNGVGVFIPGNFAVVLGAIVSARITGAAYRMAMIKINAVNSAN